MINRSILIISAMAFVGACATMGPVYDRDSVRVSYLKDGRVLFSADPRDNVRTSGSLDCSENGEVESSSGGFKEYIDETPGAVIEQGRLAMDDIVWECIDGYVKTSADSLASIFDLIGTGTPRTIGARSGYSSDTLIFVARYTYKYPSIKKGRLIHKTHVSVGQSTVRVVAENPSPSASRIYAGQDGEFEELYRERVRDAFQFDPAEDLHLYVIRGRFSSELQGWEYIRLNREEASFVWRYPEQTPDFLE